MTDDRKALIILTTLLLLLFVGVFLAAQTEKANAGDTNCPPGHTVDYVSDQDANFNGFYYLYVPNLPAGYSIVKTWDPATVTHLPPPGIYGPAARILVCYTDDIYKYAEEISSTTTTTAPATTTTSSTTTTLMNTTTTTSFTTEPPTTTSTVPPTTTTIPEIQTDIQEPSMATSVFVNLLVFMAGFFIGAVIMALLAMGGADDGS